MVEFQVGHRAYNAFFLHETSYLSQWFSSRRHYNAVPQESATRNEPPWNRFVDVVQLAAVLCGKSFFFFFGNDSSASVLDIFWQLWFSHMADWLDRKSISAICPFTCVHVGVNKTRQQISGCLSTVYAAKWDRHVCSLQHAISVALWLPMNKNTQLSAGQKVPHMRVEKNCYWKHKISKENV